MIVMLIVIGMLTAATIMSAFCTCRIKIKYVQEGWLRSLVQLPPRPFLSLWLTTALNHTYFLDSCQTNPAEQCRVVNLKKRHDSNS